MAFDAELDDLIQRMRAERWEILRELGDRVAEERALSTDPVDQPMDAAERGSELQSIEVTGKLADRAAERLGELDRALDRAARGSLGACESCGEAIPVARLEAMPGVALCQSCARDAAHREGGPGAAGPGQSVRLPLPGERVYTPSGEGSVLRLAPFGTCGLHGEIEGRYDPDRDEVLCTAEGCDNPLTDIEELAVVQIADETVTAYPEELRPVDPDPYD